MTSKPRESSARPITVATCIPRQETQIEAKMRWLEAAIKKHKPDLFLTPQEYLGGHYVRNIAQKRDEKKLPPLHVGSTWVREVVGKLAKKYQTAIGIGACIEAATEEVGGKIRGTEDYVYFDKDGSWCGLHRKFALPRYDDVRAEGAGRLWPETSWKARVTPIEIPSLRLRVGTVFCWEVFALTLVPAYAMAKTNLIAHPVKFAPRGWLKTQVIEDEQHIVGFGHAPKSEEWTERLWMLARHEALCPIAISCNSWNLGDKFKGLTGYLDGIMHTREETFEGDKPTLLQLGSDEKLDKVVTFQMTPELYSVGTDNTFSAGAFKAATGSIEGYGELGPLTMHLKMRRLESYLLNDTTRLDVLLKEQALRIKKSTHSRAAAHGVDKPAKAVGFGL